MPESASSGNSSIFFGRTDTAIALVDGIEVDSEPQWDVVLIVLVAAEIDNADVIFGFTDGTYADTSVVQKYPVALFDAVSGGLSR